MTEAKNENSNPNESLICIGYSAETVDYAKKFYDILVEAAYFNSFTFDIEESSTVGDDDVERKYVTCYINAYVDTVTLADTLEILNGLFTNISDPMHLELYQNIFDNWSVTVMMKDEVDTAELGEYNYHMHRTIQEQQKMIGTLESQNVLLHRKLIEYIQKVNQLEDRYNGLQAYLRTGIDIAGLMDVVVELAEKVDPDILEKFQYGKVQYN